MDGTGIAAIMIIDAWPAPVTGKRSGKRAIKTPSPDGKMMLEIPNLLVTDDDSAFRQVVCEGLVRRGFQVTEARDGQEAIEVLQRAQVHMALLDFHMPRLSGLEVIRHLYESPESPPCVLMSAELDDEVRREAQRMRAYDVLSKPVRMQQLTQIVCSALTAVYGWCPPDSWRS